MGEASPYYFVFMKKRLPSLERATQRKLCPSRSGNALVYKVIQMRYVWSTIKKDAKNFAKK